MRSLTIRTRLTLWYASVMIVVLIATMLSVMWILRNRLYAELDHALHEDLELFEELVRVVDNGRMVILDGEAHWREEEEEGPLGDTFLAVWSEQGELLFRNSLWPEQMPTLWQDQAVSSEAAGYRDLSLSGDTRLRCLSGFVKRKSRTYLLLVARRTERIHHALMELLFIVLTIIPLAMLLSVLGGYALVRRTLKPLDIMTDRAKKITARNLHQRLPIENEDDELGKLGAVFNEMINRLERSFYSLRQFTSDASHELRTPLTALRSIGEVALEKKRSPGQYQETIGSMLEEVLRMTRLTESLLQLCRADEGRIGLSMESLNPAALVRETADQVSVLAEAKNQELTVMVPPSVPEVSVDRNTLRIALLNLLDNAIKYSPPGSEIVCTLAASSDSVTIRIADSGPGIPAEHQPYIFDRFYRVDSGRSRKEGGTGLGLSIARWALEANGGRLTLESSGAGGSTFVVTLPIP